MTKKVGSRFTVKVHCDCDGAAHDESGPVHITAFHADGPQRWTDFVAADWTRQRKRGVVQPAVVRQYIDDQDRPFWPRRGTEHLGRVRYPMTCDTCGLAVVARSDTLYPILDVLAEHGVAEISLAALAARLRDTARGV